jgi:hypothetical protein
MENPSRKTIKRELSRRGLWEVYYANYSKKKLTDIYNKYKNEKPQPCQYKSPHDCESKFHGTEKEKTNNCICCYKNTCKAKENWIKCEYCMKKVCIDCILNCIECGKDMCKMCGILTDFHSTICFECIGDGLDISPYVLNIFKKFKKFKKQNKKLKAENIDLKYRPGGPEYQKAKTHFESLQVNEI